MIKIEKARFNFLIKDFRFENENFTVWVDSKTTKDKDYNHKLELTGVTPLNQLETLIQFKFDLEILPDIGEIHFNGDCILYSKLAFYIARILTSNVSKQIKEKNKHIEEGIIMLILRRCFDYSKEIGDKNNIRFPNYELLLKNYGIDKITYTDDKNRLPLELKKDKLIPKNKEEK